ncbi:RecX family transcriptional regulator [Flavobacteriaceae bacterium F08102]|nr:RecX family transcriptional regulator [Flavobacteriaceae bacterium F08102]
MDYNSKPLYTLEEAKRRLEKYCVYQERCHEEINSKLREMRMIPEAQVQIIEHLLACDFLNEERFAKAFARGKFNIKSWGKVRIIRELKARKITDPNIKLALAEIDDEQYLQKFDELAQRQCDRLKETNVYKKRKKLADYLLYRGWEPDMVYARLKVLIP